LILTAITKDFFNDTLKKEKYTIEENKNLFKIQAEYKKMQVYNKMRQVSWQGKVKQQRSNNTSAEVKNTTRVEMSLLHEIPKRQIYFVTSYLKAAKRPSLHLPKPRPFAS